MNKYDIANEFTRGFAAGLTFEKPRLLSESAHWIAGWDSGAKHRRLKQDSVNDYLRSIGVEEIAQVKAI